jgi:hypothetical protein
MDEGQIAEQLDIKAASLRSVIKKGKRLAANVPSSDSEMKDLDVTKVRVSGTKLRKLMEIHENGWGDAIVAAVLDVAESSVQGALKRKLGDKDDVKVETTPWKRKNAGETDDSVADAPKSARKRKSVESSQVKAQGLPKTRSSAGASKNERHGKDIFAEIFKLKQQGFNTGEIGKDLGIPRGSMPYLYRKASSLGMLEPGGSAKARKASSKAADLKVDTGSDNEEHNVDTVVTDANAEAAADDDSVTSTPSTNGAEIDHMEITSQLENLHGPELDAFVHKLRYDDNISINEIAEMLNANTGNVYRMCVRHSTNRKTPTKKEAKKFVAVSAKDLLALEDAESSHDEEGEDPKDDGEVEDEVATPKNTKSALAEDKADCDIEYDDLANYATSLGADSVTLDGGVEPYEEVTEPLEPVETPKAKPAILRKRKFISLDIGKSASVKSEVAARPKRASTRKSTPPLSNPKSKSLTKKTNQFVAVTVNDL